MRSLRKNPKEMVEIKSSITEKKKNAFNGLMSRLDRAKKKISELENSFNNIPQSTKRKTE